MIGFEWNASKAASNKKKHGVSFDEAKSVFYDEFAIQFYDEENSEFEDRFLNFLALAMNQMFFSYVIVKRIQEILLELFQLAKQPKRSVRSIKVVDNEKGIRFIKNEVS